MGPFATPAADLRTPRFDFQTLRTQEQPNPNAVNAEGQPLFKSLTLEAPLVPSSSSGVLVREPQQPETEQPKPIHDEARPIPAQAGAFEAAAMPEAPGTLETNNPEPSELHATAAELGIDHDLLSQICEKCRAEQPDATDAEIAYFLAKDGTRLRGRRQTTNLPGLLWGQVPKNFMGPTFHAWRAKMQAQMRQSADAQQAANERWQRQQAELRATLDDPAASKDDKHFARILLGLEDDEEISPSPGGEP